MCKTGCCVVLPDSRISSTSKRNHFPRSKLSASPHLVQMATRSGAFCTKRGTSSQCEYRFADRRRPKPTSHRGSQPTDSPRSRSTRTPREQPPLNPRQIQRPDTIFQSAFGVLDALLQPAFGNLPLQPFATMVGPQRPSCRIQFPLSVPETLGANLNAPAHARSRLVGHAAHLTAIAQLSCRHRYHLVAIGLQRQPLRGILRDLSRSKMLGIRIVLDRQARLAVTEVGDECFPFGDLARFLLGLTRRFISDPGEGIAASDDGECSAPGRRNASGGEAAFSATNRSADFAARRSHAAQRCGGQTTRCDVSRSKAFYCPVRCAMTGRRRTSPHWASPT